VFGILVTSFFAINETVLSLILAAFAGEFLYLGAANLLPETYLHNVWKMGAAMIFGVVLIFVLTTIILSL
jgi:zinc transporter ZupT